MRRNALLYISLLLLLLVFFVADVSLGSRLFLPIASSMTDIEWQIFWHLRLPRAVTAVYAGVGLSIAGLLMQTLFRTPLAGPYILGVSSGAGLGVAVVTMLGGAALSGVIISSAAVIGALSVLLLVLLVSRYVRSNTNLLIVGIMTGSIAGALINLIQNYSNPDSLKLFIVWTFGSLSSVGWSELVILSVVMLLGLFLSSILIKPLNGMLLGEWYARGLGVSVERTRMLILLVTGLFAGGITAFCGPIAFVGVAVPHLARGLFSSTDHRLILPACALLGADLLLCCDVLCNIFTYPVPISTMSALFGAPVIIWIILKNK